MPRQVPRSSFATLADRLQLSLVKAVYGFGSYFRGEENPEDVDILMVFDNASPASFREAMKQSATYAQGLVPEVGEEPHITSLTERECEETNFVQVVKAELLWEKSAQTS